MNSLKNKINFNNINIDEYNKQLEYFTKYYGDEFKEGQGTEIILEVINKYSKNGTLIDFGSGSNIYFWLTAFNDINDVTCVDISKESFYINEQIRKKELYPKSCKYPLKKYEKNFENILKTKIKYLIHDVLKYPIDLDQKFDNVTQFGLLGLCKNRKEYISNLKKICNLANNDGILIGANWCYNTQYSEKVGYDNNYLSEQLVRIFSEKNNYEILYNKMIPIKNDKNYKSVLVYVLKNG